MIVCREVHNEVDRFFLVMLCLVFLLRAFVFEYRWKFELIKVSGKSQ